MVYFKERAQIRRLDYQQTERVCRRPDRRRDELCQRDAHEYRHARRDQQIDLRLFGNSLAALSRGDGDYQHRERAARAALGVCRPADRREREQHHRGRLQRVAYRDRHCRAGDRHGVGTDVRDELHAELCAQRLYYRADEQRAEKPLRHCAECLNAVSLPCHCYVLFLQKSFEIAHIVTLR